MSSLKLICVSDSHNRHAEISLPKLSEEELENTVFIHAGDFTDLGLPKEVKSFELWLRSLPFKNKIVIAGNHDLCCESYEKTRRAMYRLPYEADWTSTQVPYRVYNATYLNQESFTINGINFYGEPRTPEFYDWAFNVKREDMKHVWELVPENTDVLITHGPPLNYGDAVYKRMAGMATRENVGCKFQLEMIKNHPNLKVVVCGHIHPANGSYDLVKNNGDVVKIINASVVNEKYKIKHGPFIYTVNKQ